MKLLSIFISILIVFPSIFTASPSLTHYFEETEIREYIPIVTNNILCDKLYAKVVKSSFEVAYVFLFYWEYQEGTYKFASHEHDWEFVVVYASLNGSVYQVNYDSWHYYIGRSKTFSAYNDTNVLLYVDPSFHYFKPDRQMREGNISKQLKQDVYELTDEILLLAKTQVGLDSKLFDDPFSWREMGWFGRYTAFDSVWKAFWVVADKKFDWIDLSNEESILTKML